MDGSFFRDFACTALLPPWLHLQSRNSRFTEKILGDRV
jgi:hypothetical protein